MKYKPDDVKTIGQRKYTGYQLRPPWKTADWYPAAGSYYATNVYGMDIIPTTADGSGYGFTGGSSTKVTQVKVSKTSKGSNLSPYITCYMWKRTA